ncbi:OmpL47-type beta-barrel domain-containing protein [Kitasatospora sp. NPDC004240]
MGVERGRGAWRQRLGRRLALLGLVALGAGTGFGTAPPAAAAPDAARSTKVVLTNNSDLPLIRTGHNLDHGCWTTEPPERIEPGATTSWESESCGTLTGTEGSAFFRIDNGKGPHLRIHWDNPFFGANSYSETVPNGYVVPREGGDGENATATYRFDCNSRMCDGIPDDWKRNGVTIDPGDGSGPQFIDLPAMGADVNRPDVFVHLDRMTDTSPTNAHSHQLDPQAIQQVVDAFANAPYQRRGAPRAGINLHVDAGPGSVLDFATGRTWGTLSRARQVAEVADLGSCDGDGSCEPRNGSRYRWDDFDRIKKAQGGFVSSGRAPVFHYALAAHLLAPGTTWTGLAARGSSDFALSLGRQTNQVGDRFEQATTFMHELGHNLSLDHGGFEEVNFKPHYFSVMNYDYSGDGLPIGTSRYVDYSRIATTLDETHLDEGAVPPTGSLRYDVTRNCGGTLTPARVGLAGYVDWDCDGTQDAAPVVQDVNDDGERSTALTGYDDWAHLKLTGGAIGRPGMPALAAPEEVEEYDERIARQVRPADTTAPVTTASAVPPPNAAGWNTTAVTVTLGATDDLSGVARTEYDLDGAGWTAYTAPVTVAGAGSHLLSYRSVDRSQNTEEPRSLPVRVDATPPVTTAALDPAPDAAGWIAAEGRVTLTAVDEPGGSGVAGITYSTTGAVTTPATTVPGATAGLTIDVEGETVITFHATDLAGNVEADRTLTVRLDRTAPASAFTTADHTILVALPEGGPHDDQYVTGTVTDAVSGTDHVDVTFTSEVPAPDVVSRATPSCADGTRRACTWRVRPPSGLGIYRVTAVGTDTAGNTERPGHAIHVVVARTPQG